MPDRPPFNWKNAAELKSLLEEVNLKMNKIADYGLCGEVFQNHVDEILQKHPELTRNEAAVLVALRFEKMKFTDADLDELIDRLQSNDEEVVRFMKKYRRS